MRPYLLLLLLPLFFISCSEVQTATSCSGVNYTRVKKSKTGQEPDKKNFFHHLFHHQTKAERRDSRSTKRAEKGKKTKDKTKLGKKLAFWKKKKDNNADTRDQNKGVFGQTRKSGKKQKKLTKKRSKHPQNDLWPNGHPG